MRTILIALLLALAGCAAPAGEGSFANEQTPAAAVLSGAGAGDDYSERMRAANERNDDRLLKGDWRAARPAVGPGPELQRP
ncbi:MAG: hypothetical protein RL105_1017 [Verrucomicrobiota bacterium]|jgi:hypothetical protein